MRASFGRAALQGVAALRGEPLLACYRELLASDAAPRAALDALRRRKLASLLAYARAHVPACAALPALAPAGGDDRSALARTLAALPVTGKEDLRDPARRSRDAGLVVSIDHTSGSTGRPFPFPTDQYGGAAARAAVWRALARFGVPLGAPVLRVWGTQLDLHRRIRDLAKDLLLNRRTLSSHHVTDETARACARLLARRSVEALYGFTSAVTLLAHRLEARAAGQALRVVVVTGERLEPAARRAIERSFAAAVCQEYGCTEAGPIAHECPEGSLHVNEENVILECRTCGTPLYPETGCTHAEGVLVTELNNRVLPLLRYALADGVRVLPRPCPCGRASLRLAPVIGRESEAVLTRDGSALSGMFFDYLPKYVASEVVELQFVQEAPGSLCVLVVAGPAYRDAGTRERLRALIDDAARGGLDVLVREVDAVPREPSGKIKLVKVSAR